MELFNEVYGIYYRLLHNILKAMPLTKQQIKNIVDQNGLPESTLHFLPQLLDEQNWQLFNEEDGFFTSKLKNLPELPLTTLELSWLKAVLQDKKAKLFLTDKELALLQKNLKDVQPLYQQTDFLCFDCCLDGDDYENPSYRKNFQQILSALNTKQTIQINFTSGKGKRNNGHFLPLKLEYSEKDDKFRLYCAQIKNSKITNYFTINLARIDTIVTSQEKCSTEPHLQRYFNNNRCKEPLVIKITSERNALERFSIEFSAYEKTSEFDEATNTCITNIYYQNYDQTELLIKILSFGPTIEVLAPKSFIHQIKQRIKKQVELLQQE